MDSISQQISQFFHTTYNNFQIRWASLTPEQKTVVYVVASIFSLLATLVIGSKVYRHAFKKRSYNYYDERVQHTAKLRLIKEKDLKNEELVKGKLIKADGNILEGTFFQNGLIIGKSTNPYYGKSFEGTFDVEHQKPLKGTYTSSEGTLDGLFSGEFLIKGTHTNHLNGETKSGIFSYGKLIQGTYYRKDGAVLDGTFSDEQIIKGNVTLQDGQKVEGTFCDGSLIQGKLTLPNGEERTGIFNKGNFIGKIKRTNGTVEEGEFSLKGEKISLADVFKPKPTK